MSNSPEYAGTARRAPAIARILCVVDPTVEAQPALARAAWFAGCVGATLELLVCFYDEYLAGTRFDDAESLRQMRESAMAGLRERLEGHAAPLRADGLDVHTAVTWDHPLHDGIVRHAARTNADLVFKDTHHHGALSRSMFTNTDWNLIRNCASPLWLVKPGGQPRQPIFLAAIDPLHANDKPAALDDKILQTAAALSAATAGKMHAFHAYDARFALTSVAENAYVPVPLLADELRKDMHRRHDARFRELTEFHGIGPDRAHLVEGLTHEVLPELARELSATVVVIGAVSRSRVGRLFIGSTAERTLEHLPCDLLIVKPDWHSVPAEVMPELIA
ncbi:MAG TPA: universal stress protein [Woeseiaceae bacterium]|nr:universal stress protein [Woeseiaceae bacterium]